MVRKSEAMTADHGVRVVVDQSFELLLENARCPQPDPNAPKAFAELTWPLWRKSITRLTRFRTNSRMRAEANKANTNSMRAGLACTLDFHVARRKHKRSVRDCCCVVLQSKRLLSSSACCTESQSPMPTQ